MNRWLVARIGTLIPTFLGVTLVSFAVMHLAPGKPTDLVSDLNIKVSLQAKERLVALYGLDRPIHRQYLSWVKRIIQGDFGRSFKDGRLVLTLILERIPVTLLINALTLILTVLIAVPLGVWSASQEGSLADQILTFFLFIGFSVPTFWLALLGLDLFGVRLAWLPVSGFASLQFDRLGFGPRLVDVARHLILPVSILVVGEVAVLSRYIRASTLEVLGQDYIKTARAKGLSERAVYFRHALRNALLPLITLLGLSIPALIGGSVILESIFAIPGMGRLFFDSVVSRDYPVIMGIVVLGAFLTLLGNLLADITYALADPRIRTSGQRR